MLNTILRNLLNNALKYTSSEGVVEVKAIPNHKWVDISITDNGVGMSPETVNRLLRPGINPASLKGTKGEKGSGLGLVLCREFVEKHGSTITIESKPSQGSTFRFSIPLV